MYYRSVWPYGLTFCRLANVNRYNIYTHNFSKHDEQQCQAFFKGKRTHSNAKKAPANGCSAFAVPEVGRRLLHVVSGQPGEKNHWANASNKIIIRILRYYGLLLEIVDYKFVSGHFYSSKYCISLLMERRYYTQFYDLFLEYSNSHS